MPTGYVKQQAKKHHTSVGKSEERWRAAKASAKKQGHGEDFAYITGIYKKMMGEDVKNLSLKQFLSLTERDLEGASDIAYGRDKNDEFGQEGEDEFGDEEFPEDDFEGDMGDEGDFEGQGEHELAGILGPDELEDQGDEDLGDEEFPEDEFGDEEFPEDEFGDEAPEGDEDMQRGAPARRGVPMREDAYDQPKFNFLKELMIITEKKHGKKLKKAAKSVYHRDYVKTKNKPYRKYDKENRQKDQ